MLSKILYRAAVVAALILTCSCGVGDDDGQLMRSGSFSAYDEFGDIIYEGTYRCDNNNLKLEYTNDSGGKQTILAQVLSFTEDTMTLRYENEEYNVSVTLILRKETGS